MFPSTDNFEFLFKKSSPPPLFSDHQTFTPAADHFDPSSIFFTFPSPFFDEHESPLNQILSQNQTMSPQNHLLDKKDSISAPNPTKKGKTTKQRSVAVTGDQAPAVRRRNLGVVPRKRTGKKDRHSKICTAQGIRDRRMRLSLQVARKFFDLQDMLGYDKASKTIEWLFTKSKKAIKELVSDHPNVNISINEAKSESFVSECEVVSPNVDNSAIVHEAKEGVLPTNPVSLCNITPCDETKLRKKAVCKPNNMRESRDKARARARCRTMEKMMIKGIHFLGNPNDKNPIEGVDQESGSINQERVFGYGVENHHHFTSLEQELLDDVGTIEKFLKGSCSSSSRSCPSVSEYNHCSVKNAFSSCIDSNFMGLIGNLDLVSMNSSPYSVTTQVPLAGSSSNSPFEGVDQEPDQYSCKQERVPHQFEADVGTIEKLLAINSSSPSISNGGNNNFMGFIGNWDMMNLNIERLNSNAVTSHLSLAGNSNSSIYSASINPS